MNNVKCKWYGLGFQVSFRNGSRNIGRR